MKIKFLKNKSGFTLLEILVVLGIIGVILAVVSVSYGTAQRKSRDVKRREDFKALQNCLEQYYSINTSTPYQYPIISAGGANSGFLTVQCDTSSSPQSITVVDPLNTGSNIYKVNSSSSTSYSVQAPLEVGPTIAISNLQ